MKIFVDVGAHMGETIIEVKKYKYAFDLIYAFEPSKKCLFSLNKFSNKKISIINAGLSNNNCTLELIDPGSLGASTINNDNKGAYKERVKMIKISDWFKKNIVQKDVVVVKLNCEGGECDIIEDLIESGEIFKIHSMLITFDIREFKNLKYKEIIIRNKLKN